MRGKESSARTTRVARRRQGVRRREGKEGRRCLDTNLQLLGELSLGRSSVIPVSFRSHSAQQDRASQSRARFFGGLPIDSLEKCDAVENTQAHLKPGTDIISQSLEYDVQYKWI